MSSTRRGSVAAGFAAARHGKLVLLLALTTFVLGALGASPIRPAFESALGQTLNGDHFIRNHPSFAPTDFADFVVTQEYARKGLYRTALAAGVLGVLLQVFFAGGIVSVLGRGRFAFAQFFEPARRNLWHNVKCLVLFGAALAAFAGAWGGLREGAHRLLENVPPDAASRRAAWWAILLVGVLLFGVWSLVYDFARAARRYAPGIGVLRGVRFALRALKGSWRSALLLFAFWFAAGTAAVCIAFAAAWFLPAVSIPAVVLLFLLQLAGLWLRAAVRVAAWGSYLAFLDPRAGRAMASLERMTPRAAVQAPELTLSRSTP
jgi:hypothetical protein